jgi:hemoglobin-like flavoprotein
MEQPLDVALIRSSFAMVIGRQPALVHRFYEILFERRPELSSLFSRRPPEVHEALLGKALVDVVANLDNAPAILPKLEALGARHVGYGVSPVMFDWVGEALLAALEEAAGDNWSPEVANAWTHAFGIIAGAMQRGVERARAA